MSGMANTVEGVVLEQCLTQLAFLIGVDFLLLSVVVEVSVTGWRCIFFVCVLVIFLVFAFFIGVDFLLSSVVD